jgi:hypothetical protein
VIFGQLAEPDHQGTSFMQHFVFFIGSFLIFSVNGFVVVLASTGRNLSYPELLAAPVVGTCVLSILVTGLYFWGVPPYVTTVSGTVISGAIIAGKFFLASNKPRFAVAARPDLAVRILCLAFVACVILLPHYLGGQQFAIFQGNRHDTVNYLSGAFGYANYSYAYLTSFDLASEPAAGLAGAAAMLNARPTVALLYASLYKTLSRDFVINAYDYCLVGQLNLYFAGLYLFLNVFPKHDRILHIAAVALATGFFAQYIFDINAWSELFAVPVMLVLITDFCRGLLMFRPHKDYGAAEPLQSLSGPRARSVFMFVRLPVTAAGLVYLYPEIASVAGLACGAALVYVIAEDSFQGRYKSAMTALGISASFALIALLLIGGYWNGTLGFFLSQLRMATSSSVEWHRFFQAYLFGGTTEVTEHIQSARGLAYLFYVFIAAPANFLAGIFGLYFLQPRGLWRQSLSLPFLLWLPILLLWLLVVLLGIAASARREFKNPDSRNALFRPIGVGGLVTLIIPVGLAWKAQYWSAGKSLSMIAPFVFLALLLPIAAGHVRRIVVALCWLVIGGHLYLGLYRSVVIAVRADGGHFSYPYPTLPKETRTHVDWDISSYEADIQRCTLIEVDIGEPFLERVVENYVMEKKIRWFSPNPQFSYYGAGSELPMMRTPDGKLEDCTIATEFKPDSIGQKIILLNAKSQKPTDR